MSIKLNKYQIEKFSRQIVLKDIGVLGQKKIIKARKINERTENFCAPPL